MVQKVPEEMPMEHGVQKQGREMAQSVPVEMPKVRVVRERVMVQMVLVEMSMEHGVQN
jgi:hypothetical protein